MKYNQIESATLRTNHAKSCATLKRTNVYRTQQCPKCITGTLEFFYDTAARTDYAHCLNCGKEFFPRTPVPVL